MSNRTGVPRILINMPLLLTRRVLVQNEDGAMVPDTNWHERMRVLFGGLLGFLRSEGMLARVELAEMDIDGVVLTEGDLTQKGQTLWRSGAIDRWLRSFDRAPGKSPSDYRQLVSALKKVSD